MNSELKITKENINLKGIENDFTPHTQLINLDTAEITSTANEMAKITPSDNNVIIVPVDGDIEGGNLKLFSSERKDSGCGSTGGQSGSGNDGKTKLEKKETKTNRQQKNKRKRRRGKQKCNSKLFTKSNWKFQMPQRYRSGQKSSAESMNNVLRKQFQRQRSIVPYNTNKFLMEEHMAELPNALITPNNGRTRDSSFSVDSEDNYFFSLPEDEEEFLTKEFSNVYERARVERLETMTKQQLIEECLQIEDRYSQNDAKQQQKFSAEYVAKIRFLEERVQKLNRENNDLRRRLDHSLPTFVTENVSSSKIISHKNNKTERMCSSEDSESDSSSSSSSSSSCTSSCSSSSVSLYSPACSPKSHHLEESANTDLQNHESDNEMNEDDQMQQPEEEVFEETELNSYTNYNGNNSNEDAGLE